jgi:hypothetical protein
VGTEQSADERAAAPEASPAAPAAAAAAPGFSGVDALMRMQHTIGNRAVGRWIAQPAGQAWTTADRTAVTQRWKDACIANLSAVDSSQYRRIVERRDGRDAVGHAGARRRADARQPMYARMSQQTKDQLEYIARQKRFAGWGAWITSEGHVGPGTFHNEDDVPAFDQPNLQSIGDRWRYGMGLGDRFAKGGTGFNPATNLMPSVGSEYSSGAEFTRLSTRQALDQLDAWRNPNRISRVGSGLQLRYPSRSHGYVR